MSTFRRCLTPQRLDLLWVTAERHSQSMRKLAGVLGRDPSDVQDDLDYLASVGLIEFRAGGPRRKAKVPVVPYDRVDLSLELRGQAA